MIVATQLAKRFRGVQAVRNVSFEACDGQITGLLGPNGAGKTTTLRMLYTLLPPDAGQILIDRIDATRDPLAARARLGVLPDGKGLYRGLTARENINYFAALSGLSHSARRAACSRLIGELDMDAFADQIVAGHSTGQRLKTALARALVHDPQNLILDEPTNGLDVMATRQLRAFLLRAKAAGRCVVLSSHVMQEVAALCDRIVVMAHGSVVAAGTVDSLRQQAGESTLEDAFVTLLGSGEGVRA